MYNHDAASNNRVDMYNHDAASNDRVDMYNHDMIVILMAVVSRIMFM